MLTLEDMNYMIEFVFSTGLTLVKFLLRLEFSKRIPVKKTWYRFDGPQG
jgi:hypothetical protein